MWAPTPDVDEDVTPTRSFEGPDPDDPSRSRRVPRLSASDVKPRIGVASPPCGFGFLCVDRSFVFDVAPTLR